MRLGPWRGQGTRFVWSLGQTLASRKKLRRRGGPNALVFRAGCSRGDEEGPRRPGSLEPRSSRFELQIHRADRRAGARGARARGARAEGGGPHGLQNRFEVRTSWFEVRGFLAFGGPPRRHGRTQREKLVRLDPGRGPGTRFEWSLIRRAGVPDLRRREKITTGGFRPFSASGGPRRAPGPSKNDSG